MSINPLVVNVGVSVTHANVNVMVPVTKLDYIEMRLSTRLDITGRYRYITEVYAVVDNVQLNFESAYRHSFLVDDINTRVFTKGVLDAVAFTEEVVKTLIFIRDFKDTALLTEAKQIQLAKAIAEEMSVVDLRSLLVSKIIADGVAINDLADVVDGITFQAIKAIMNIAFTGDIATVASDKLLVDSQPVTDTPLLNLMLIKTDKFGFSDTASSNTGKALFDTQALQDAVRYAVNKALADAITLVEFTATSVNKPLTGFTAPLDAGLLIKQGYCDLTYFADDYIGETRAF